MSPSLFLSPTASTTKPALICFSHLRWNFVWQRPQHLLSRAASLHDVIYFEEPSFEAVTTPELDLTKPASGVTVALPVLPYGVSEADISAILRGFIEQLYDHLPSRPAVLWYYTPMAMAFTRKLAADVIVYDNMDELSLFTGASRKLIEHEHDLLARADLVFTGGASLYAAKRGRHPRIHCFPSSVDVAHFAAARAQGVVDPSDQAGIAHPRLGFFGVIDERMNLALLVEVAMQRPDWQFCMVGPVAKLDLSSLPQLPNIHWLGPKAYEELPAYLAHWDVGFMNFALNEATRFISPTKTPEFLAAGVPTVSTPIADVVEPYGRLGLVEIAQTAQDVMSKVELIMARPKEPWLRKVDTYLMGGSWDQTWAAMHKLVLEQRPHQTQASPLTSDLARQTGAVESHNV